MFSRKKKKLKQQCDRLAGVSCQLFSDMTGVLERYLEDGTRYDYDKILLYANGLMAIVCRWRNSKHPQLDQILETFSRSAARSITISLLEYGHIKDKGAFYENHITHSLGDFADSIDEPATGMIHGDGAAARTLAEGFLQAVAGGGHGLKGKKFEKFAAELDDRILVAVRKAW